MASNSLNPLKKRFILFIFLNVIIAGIIGPTLLNEKFLNVFHFSIYEILMNLVFLWLALFIVINRNKFKTLTIGSYNKGNLLFILFATLLTILFFVIKNILSQYSSFSENFPLAVSAHVIVFSIPTLIFLGIFGYKLLITLVKNFYKEIIISGLVSFLFTLVLIKLISAWLILTSIILIFTKFLLSLSSISATILPPTTLALDKLTIDVGQTCSGIESIFLFSIFYLLISTFEWDNFNKTKVILLYIPSVIGLFFLNAFRVYLLIIISLFISPSFSLGTLHTNLGLIFFVLYFSLFWKLFYSWMKK